MTAFDARHLQQALGVHVDGIAGLQTWTALFAKLGASPARASDFAVSAKAHFADYGITDNKLRVAHFMAQIQHESGNFRYMRELWGPTPAQKGYEGRANLGNTQAGDGLRYLGRGPIQITGRANYRHFGTVLCLPLEQHPEMAETPATGLLIALAYWSEHKLNALADADDITTITKRINGGLNGIVDRKICLARLKEMLG